MMGTTVNNPTVINTTTPLNGFEKYPNSFEIRHGNLTLYPKGYFKKKNCLKALKALNDMKSIDWNQVTRESIRDMSDDKRNAWAKAVDDILLPLMNGGTR